jgi:hypothetical protein
MNQLKQLKHLGTETAVLVKPPSSETGDLKLGRQNDHSNGKAKLQTKL